MSTTLVVLPTYNEAGSVVDMLSRIRAVVPEAHILVVDDSSPDGTADLAEMANRELGNIEVLRRPAKSGLGSAYRDGFRWGIARGFDFCVEIDADGSHDPAALPAMLARAREGADLVIGSRYVEGGSIPNWAWHRRALSKWGNRYAARMLRLDVRDATAGYRVYRAATLAKLDLDLIQADGYGFQIEMTYQFGLLGAVIAESPIAFVDREIGTSKMSGNIIVEAMALVTWWGVRDRVLHRTGATAVVPHH